MNTKTCPVCGKEFQPKKETQVCCSSNCAAKKKGMETRKYRTCRNCGASFWNSRASKYRLIYCSESCKNEAYQKAHPQKEKVLFHKTCSWCGKEFITSGHSQFCSKECAYEHNKKIKRDQWAKNYKPKKLVCKECGKTFMTECGNTHSVFCCSVCAIVYEKKQKRKSERHKKALNQQKKERERLIRKNFVDDVSYDVLFKRDKGICQICGMPVPQEKGCDNNWDGTIDHIIPLTVGGEHSYENCQLAHRICNSLKNQSTDVFIDWPGKAKTNEYWKMKYDAYKRLMDACPL